MSHLLETRRGMGIRRCARYARILLASIARASFTYRIRDDSRGVLAVLEGRTTLSSAIVQVSVSNHKAHGRAHRKVDIRLG